MSPDNRIFLLIMIWVGVVAAVASAIVAIRGWGKRPWTDHTKRAIYGVMSLGALAAWFFTLLHLN
jgi:hypothetical protein